MHESHFTGKHGSYTHIESFCLIHGLIKTSPVFLSLSQPVLRVQSSYTLNVFSMLSLLVTLMNTNQPVEALTHSECEDLSTYLLGLSGLARTSASDYRRCGFKSLFWICPIIQQPKYDRIKLKCLVTYRDLER